MILRLFVVFLLLNVDSSHNGITHALRSVISIAINCYQLKYIIISYINKERKTSHFFSIYTFLFLYIWFFFSFRAIVVRPATHPPILIAWYDIIYWCNLRIFVDCLTYIYNHCNESVSVIRCCWRSVQFVNINCAMCNLCVLCAASAYFIFQLLL